MFSQHNSKNFPRNICNNYKFCKYCNGESQEKVNAIAIIIQQLKTDLHWENSFIRYPPFEWIPLSWIVNSNWLQQQNSTCFYIITTIASPCFYLTALHLPYSIVLTLWMRWDYIIYIRVINIQSKVKPTLF